MWGMKPNALTTTALNAKVAAARAAIASGKPKVTINDGGGLLLVLRGQSAAWILRVQVDGRRRDLALGALQDMGLKDARIAAVQARSRAEAAPAVAEPVAWRKGGTVDELMEAWIKSQTISDVYQNNIRVALLANVLPAIGDRLAADVQRADIDAILRKVEERGALDFVRRLRMWLRLMWDFAIDSEQWPGIEDSPVRTGKLVSFKAHTKGHFPAITNSAQVPKLMQAIRLTNSTITRHALLLSAYVWQRPGEIREAVWEEFDLAGAKWTIPAARMKKAREHWVPLPRQVVELLQLHQGLVGTTGLLFPGLKKGEPISEATLQKRIRDAGYGGMHTPHGFRAMARTIGREVLKLPVDALEKHLSHETGDPLNGAYDRAELWDERVDALQRWADWLDAQK